MDTRLCTWRASALPTEHMAKPLFAVALRGMIKVK